MKLFKYEGYRVTIEPEALLLKPFKKIWDRDRSVNKDKALLELGFVYFYCDPRSDYQYITDPDDRMKAIKESEGIQESWKPDKYLNEAMEFYEKNTNSTATLLLADTRYAIDKLRILLRDIDLTRTDNSGKPVYTLNTITSTIKLIPQLVKDLDEAERAIKKELVIGNKMRGQGEKTLFEDGF